MKKIGPVIHSQQGSAMLAALMVFLVLSVLGAAIISVAGMESKMALNDARAEQARQAADSGVQIARDVLMNYLGSGKSIPAIADIGLNEIPLGGNSYAEIKSIALDRNAGLATIQSEGKVKIGGKVIASKTAQAGILINSLPSTPLHTKSLTTSGRYFATLSTRKVIFEGSFLEGLSNLQDFDIQGTDGRGIGHPLFGREYSDPIFKDLKHPYYCASNSNNTTNNRTWWVNYTGYNALGTPDYSQSTLFHAPFWKPKGIVDIIKPDGNPAPIALNNWDNTISISGLFDYRLTMPNLFLPDKNVLLSWIGKKETYWAPEILNSQDFLGKLNPVENIPAPVFADLDLARYKEISLNDPDWLYIASDSSLLTLNTKPDGSTYYKLLIDDYRITKTKWYIDRPSEDTVVLDFTTKDSWTGQKWTGWDKFNQFVNSALNEVGTFFNRFNNRLASVMVVSPATLEVGYDSLLFKGVNSDPNAKPHIFLLSGCDVNLSIDPTVFNDLARILPNNESDREVRTYILAGRNVNIVSTPEKMTFKGVISAGDNLHIKMDYFPEHEKGIIIRELEKKVTIIQDESIIDEFPEPWAYIGVAPIVSYKYTN